MFGVPRLLAIAVENISRIDFVWPLCVPHLLRAAATGTGEVRACAVECYTKVRCMAKHLPLSVGHPHKSNTRPHMFGFVGAGSSG